MTGLHSVRFVSQNPTILARISNRKRQRSEIIPSVPLRIPLPIHMPVFKCRYLASPVSMCTYSRKEYDLGSTSSARAGSSSFSSVSRGPTRQPSVLTLIKAGGWSWVCRRKLASRWVERSGATSCESCPPGWCEGMPISSSRVLTTSARNDD